MTDIDVEAVPVCQGALDELLAGIEEVRQLLTGDGPVAMFPKAPPLLQRGARTAIAVPTAHPNAHLELQVEPIDDRHVRLTWWANGVPAPMRHVVKVFGGSWAGG